MEKDGEMDVRGQCGLFLCRCVCVCVFVQERVTLREREWVGCIMENDCFQQICRREDSSLHRGKEKKQWRIVGNGNSHPAVTI